MPDFIASVIRTVVPSAVGALLTWLASIGLDLGDDARVGLIAAGTTLLTGLYYTAVRSLEAKWPAAGAFLGVAKQPAYDAATDADTSAYVDDSVEATDPALDAAEPSQFANDTVLQDDLDNPDVSAFTDEAPAAQVPAVGEVQK